MSFGFMVVDNFGVSSLDVEYPALASYSVWIGPGDTRLAVDKDFAFAGVKGGALYGFSVDLNGSTLTVTSGVATTLYLFTVSGFQESSCSYGIELLDAAGYKTFTSCASHYSTYQVGGVRALDGHRSKSPHLDGFAINPEHIYCMVAQIPYLNFLRSDPKRNKYIVTSYRLLISNSNGWSSLDMRRVGSVVRSFIPSMIRKNPTTLCTILELRS